MHKFFDLNLCIFLYFKLKGLLLFIYMRCFKVLMEGREGGGAVRFHHE